MLLLKDLHELVTLQHPPQALERGRGDDANRPAIEGDDHFIAGPDAELVSDRFRDDHLALRANALSHTSSITVAFPQVGLFSMPATLPRGTDARALCTLA